MSSIRSVVMAKLAANEGICDDHEAEVVAAIDYTIAEYTDRLLPEMDKILRVVEDAERVDE